MAGQAFCHLKRLIHGTTQLPVHRPTGKSMAGCTLVAVTIVRFLPVAGSVWTAPLLMMEETA